MENLSNLRICIQKPLPDEIHMLEHLKNKSNSTHHFRRMSAAFLTQKLWKNGSNVNISFEDPSTFTRVANWTPIAVMKGKRNQDGTDVKIDPIEYEIRNLTPIEAVKKVVRDRIQPICNLNFKFLPPGSRGHVRVGFDSTKGSNSLVGTDCLKSKEKVTLNLAWLDAGTIMHEFGHVLGLIHEHQNPRGIEIPWNDSAVYAWAKQTQGWDEAVTYANIIEKYTLNQTNGSNFDSQSIMLYFFPSKLTTNGTGTNANQCLSPTDVTYVNKIYPGTKLTPAEFYKKVYNIDISNYKEPSSSGKINWKSIFVYVLIILAVLILGYAIYKVFKYLKKPNSPSSMYEDLYKKSPPIINKTPPSTSPYFDNIVSPYSTL